MTTMKYVVYVVVFGVFVLNIFNLNLYSAERRDDGGWVSIELPHAFFYPCNNPPCGGRDTGIYSLKFPSTKPEWFREVREADCGDAMRTTSKRYVSNRHENVKGLQFKGLVYKSELGKRENEFAVFFHKERCYNGGPEYGFVFPENTKTGYFYICNYCNQENQKWCQWPGDCKAINGQSEEVQAALANPVVYRYWSIKVLRNGNFLVEVIDPTTWDYKGCEIQKPDWLPNLYGETGYITVNAQKYVDTNIPAVMHVDEVKIWK